MIVKIVHICKANRFDFIDEVRSEVAKMQNECGLNVEVQYQIATTTDENQYVVYSALIIGRESEGNEDMKPIYKHYTDRGAVYITSEPKKREEGNEESCNN